MNTPMILGVMVVMAGIAHGVLAGPATGTVLSATNASIALPDGIAVDDRYVMPHLPDTVVSELTTAEQAGDQYLAERTALADLVIGEHIMPAEDLANAYARDLPGFAAVLQSDGFRQDAKGAWFYDRYSSWMRFPLNR